MSSDSKTICKYCSQRIRSDDSVVLWDGGCYCCDCVENASPRLSSYAATHQRLEEAAPYDRETIIRGFAIMYIAIGLLFGVPFGLGGVQSYGVAGATFGLIGLLFAGIAAVIQVPGFLWLIKLRLPTVVVENGTVKVLRGPNKIFVREAAIETVRWRIGKAKKDSGLRGMPLPNKVVLLDLPKGKIFGFARYERVACGWSDEMRDVWEAFLTLTRAGSED